MAPDTDLEDTPLLNPPQKPRNRAWVSFLVCVVIVTIDFGRYLSIAPQTQLLESIICRRQGQSQEHQATDPCKTLEEQSELALVNGWKDTLDALPGILLAVPYEFLADRI
ncbi:hypothetical protein BDV59DRAFT_188585 [Aspergillus ambiguus]|uniref:uncharacterized protein n=1 Tax=Aspergillus ambiguus TaxID=176160 RepID=UPI003CCDCC6E